MSDEVVEKGEVVDDVCHSSKSTSEEENAKSSEDMEVSDSKMEEENITSTGRMVSVPGASIQFKKPLLVGPRKAVKKIKILNVGSNGSAEDVSGSDDKGTAVKKSDKSPAEKIAENNIPVPYKEPKWSGLPPNPYSFEVIKSGTIVETIDLCKRPYHVFGRLGNCDIVMAHPTVSRFHAVMQYRVEGDNNYGPGYYVYDLGSTHGTFLNKNRLKPNVYYRVQVGHMIKIGLSTRNFILQGPQEDEEAESELSVTELKELRLKEELAEKQRIAMELLEEEKRKKKEEEDGIDWGMGEDADEETDLSENPFAVSQNEELYINDPKKTLRGWFEREGYELEYNCQEKSFGQFVCRVELPIDNAKGVPTIAEAVVRGKKKEAVVQCALEACKILDQFGLLRQSNHESKKRKAKNWEENDYYDSDDDTFLDRTGTVEKKRQLRMEQAGVKTNKEVHTYQSLLEQHQKIIDNIKRIEQQIKESNKTEEDKPEEDENVDALDAFMSNLKNNDTDKKKTSIHKLKAELASLRQEEVNIRNLANVAKPAELPELKPSPFLQVTKEVKTVNKLPIFGKRRVTKKPLMVFQGHDEGDKVTDDNDEMDVD
ncbi:hypothetical protein RUM43_002671 [Polyplax serrata]|uniref:FHA domain-containing protein n=1 Tax=Polyplax serrata TaxID=468196 RepID=A0AAN8P2I3_POLSC